MNGTAALWFCLCSIAGGTLGNAAVRMDHPSGFYQAPFSLALSAPGPKASIFFTTNGTAPTRLNSILYTRPIPVTTTTILRAAADTADAERSDIASSTYLFPTDALTQTGAPFPATWGTNLGVAVPAHYHLAPVSGDAERRQVMTALASLPSLSIITDPSNLFSPNDGIYSHPMERGAAWERPVSAELLDPQGAAEFRIECGLRIHGGTSRRAEESPKHSFRLVFRRRYGFPKPRVAWFDADGPRQFDSLILRAGNNDSWLASDGESRRHADYLRDEWMRRSLLAMGYPSARGRFVHLYLNGLYWGIYNLCERPGPLVFADAQSQPAPDYDTRKGDSIQAGDSLAWNQLMAMANSGVSQSKDYEQISRRVDLTQLIDYLILNFYAGNSDWDRSANWYAFRPKSPDGKFRFLIWDAERSLQSPEANTLDFDDDLSPPRLFQKLSENAEFRSRFADRTKRLLLGDGPLAPGPASARYMTLVRSLGPAIAAEAARWGAYRKEAHPYKTGPYERYTRESHWEPEVDRLLKSYFPRRGEILIRQFRERGLF